MIALGSLTEGTLISASAISMAVKVEKNKKIKQIRRKKSET